MIDNNVKINIEKIKKVFSILKYILRHKPESARLKLDENGFCDIAPVLSCLNIKYKISFTQDEILNLVKQYSAVLEIKENKIRARFGHTVILNLSVSDDFEECNKVPNQLFVLVDKRDVWSVHTSGLKISNFKSNMIADINLIKRNENCKIIIIYSDKAFKKNSKFFYSELKKCYNCKFISPEFLAVSNE